MELLWPWPPAYAFNYRATVGKVSDGDTITLDTDPPRRIRVEAIDCPELRQPFGQEAKDFTAKLTLKQRVKIYPTTTDRYGRSVARVTLPDGRDLSTALVNAGLAWVYRKYSDDQALIRLEDEARRAKRGLWADSNPIPPWEWRRGRRTDLNEPLRHAYGPYSEKEKPRTTKGTGNDR